jgi:cation diffusion facilitator CzcD-associated flavoprotein CzcO
MKSHRPNTGFRAAKHRWGLWNYGANLASSKVGALVMQSQAHIGRSQCTQGFCSPIYDNLETNIPHNLIQYCDFQFPPGTALLPKHDVVAAYLQAYAAPVHHLIRFNAQVLDIRPKYSCSAAVWTVTSQDLCTQKCTREEFDAVIVANGHH